MALTITNSGFGTMSQNFISQHIASNFYKKSPLAAVVGALTIGNNDKNSLEIGRPDSGEILDGGFVDPIEKESIGTINEYLARIQGFKTQNTRELGLYDDLPGIANQSTRSHSQAAQYAASFHWGEIVTEIVIQHEDQERWLERGGNSEDGLGIQISKGVRESTEVAMQDHLDAMIENLWNGNPTDQTAQLWTSATTDPFGGSPGACLGVFQMTSATNTYGNINRSTGDNATVWGASVDSTLTSDDVQTIIDDFKYTKGLDDTGAGPYLMLVPNNQYVKFKRQIKASHTVIENMPTGLPQMAKMGVQMELLRCDNVYIARDPWLTTNSYTQTVVMLDTSTIRFMLKPGRNFKVGKFNDQTDYGNRPSDIDRAFIRTRFIFANKNPKRSCRYTAIAA